MSAADTIQPTHLRRLAVVYVRQSSPHQTLTHQESLKLQYALQDHARAAGWDPAQVRVIDTDLGMQRCPYQPRDAQGFQELVTLVTLERVGIILAYDATRLARNCTDWYQLLDLCGYRQSPRRRPGTTCLRPWATLQRPPDPRPQGLDLQARDAHAARPPHRRAAQQGPARRTGPAGFLPRRPGP